MDINQSPSVPQLQLLFSACSDHGSHHMLRVGKDGEVHLDPVPAELTPVGYFKLTEPQQQFRKETDLRGNGYVCTTAAGDVAISRLSCGIASRTASATRRPPAA